jgi:hypothetical protein
MAGMRHASLCLALVFISSGPAFAQNAVADWFPLQIGARWIYQHETRDENGRGRAHLEIHLWTTEETVVGLWPVPEGTVIERRVRVLDGSPRSDYRVAPNPAYLIRADCLYSDEVSWDPLTHQLTPGFLKGLRDGYVSPDFCFPFVIHKTWGAPHGLPDWGVNRPEEAKDWQVAGMRQKAFHITSASSYLGSGMTADIWFKKSVGIIREEDIHHGTIGEERTRLLRFDPAPSQAR